MTTRARSFSRRGLGTRMRAGGSAACPLSRRAAATAADAGLKAMMPVDGRPFLDYVLASLADAGHPRRSPWSSRRITIRCARTMTRGRRAGRRSTSSSSRRRCGTANAVLAAEAWASGEPFLVMNADNLYPVDALRALASLDEPGLARVRARRSGRARATFPPSGSARSRWSSVDDGGYLTGIVEKPAEPATCRRPA